MHFFLGAVDTPKTQHPIFGHLFPNSLIEAQSNKYPI
jgi:hypothetical protein